MISMSEHLHNIYVDFARNINNETNLCQLKGCSFEFGCLPNYNDLQIQRLYLLRYSYAYGFEYSGIYSEALKRLGNPKRVCVASIGCGNLLDYWSFTQAVEKQKQECEIRYVGIDKVNWKYKFNKRDNDEVYFREDDAINCFENNKEFISDIYFFPKSISEFDENEIDVIADNFRMKPILKDKLIFCFSLRANAGNRGMDMLKTKKIMEALEANGFRLNTSVNEYYSYDDNVGIIACDSNYVYPNDVYEYIISLNKKCGSYIKNGVNCSGDCMMHLDRRPVTKTGNIYYQLIEIERRGA